MSEKVVEEIRCPDCGLVFVVEKGVVDNWRQNQRFFWCPNGHNMQFSKSSNSEEQITRLKEQIEQLKAKNEELQAKNKELQAELEIWAPSEKVS